MFNNAPTFCDECLCDTPHDVDTGLTHAKTMGGKWICNYCFDDIGMTNANLISNWQPSSSMESYPLPVDNSRLAHIAGVIYEKIFVPVNKFLDWVSNGFSTPKKP